jgi:hypothetical protein
VFVVVRRIRIVGGIFGLVGAVMTSRFGFVDGDIDNVIRREGAGEWS